MRYDCDEHNTTDMPSSPQAYKEQGFTSILTGDEKRILSYEHACTKYARNKMSRRCLVGIRLIPQWEQRLEKK